MVTVTDTAPIAGQNDEREQKSMNRETYETYSAAEPEKIDLIAFLAEYFQAFQKFFFGVLALVILAGGGSFLTAKLRYQPVYEAYTSFVVGSNRAVGYSYYDNVTAEQLGKTFATVYKGNIIKNLIMDCQSYTKYRPNETTGGIFVSWRRKEELPTGA